MRTCWGQAGRSFSDPATTATHQKNRHRTSPQDVMHCRARNPGSGLSWNLSVLAAMTVAILVGHASASASQDAPGDLQAQFTALDKAGRYEEAVPLGVRLVEFYRTSLGENHPCTAVAAARVAYLLALTNDYLNAERMVRLVLDVPTAALEPEHLAAAESIHNLAFRYQESLGDHERASLLNRKALTIREHLLPPDDLSVAQSRYRLAVSRQQAGDDEAAQGLYKQNTRVLLARAQGEVKLILEAQAKLDQQKSEALKTADGLAHAGKQLEQLGAYQAAISTLEEVVRVRAQIARGSYRFCCGVPEALRDLSRAYGAAGKHDLALAAEEARELYGISAEHIRFAFAPGDPNDPVAIAGEHIRSLLHGPGVPDPDELDLAPQPPRPPQ